MRFAPFVHRLDYAVFQILIDVDHVGEQAAGLRWFAYNRFAPLSFHDADHGDRSGQPLRAWADARFAEAGIMLDGGAIRLLCFPRVLGFVFNPISVFFGHRPDGSLAGVIYEVNNTFGETHSYVAAAGSGPRVRQEATKTFHVSPFFDVSGVYRFTLRPPDDALSLVIEKHSGGARDHLATLKARRHAFTDPELAKAFFAIPLMTLQVVAGIHWEALKLWIKGARYHSKPNPPAPSSLGNSLDADSPRALS